MKANKSQILNELIRIIDAAHHYSADLLTKFGIDEYLKDLHLLLVDLPQVPYRNAFKKRINEFLKQPMYANADLKSTVKIKAIRDDRNFQDAMHGVIIEFQTALRPKIKELRNFFRAQEKNKFTLDEILEAVPLDRPGLFLALDVLKKEKEIKDFDEKNVIK